MLLEVLYHSLRAVSHFVLNLVIFVERVYTTVLNQRRGEVNQTWYSAAIGPQQNRNYKLDVVCIKQPAD